MNAEARPESRRHGEQGGPNATIHWRDHILFYEYFHGDNGAGLGASHQTGWTGLVAKSIQLYGLLDAKRALEGGKSSGIFQGSRDREKLPIA